MIAGLDAARVAAAVEALGRETGDATRVAGAAVDVRDGSAVEKLVSDAARAFGGFDVLVNNAGVGGFADVAVMTDEDWHRVIDTNLTGVFYCSRAAIPWLKKAGGGWI